MASEKYEDVEETLRQLLLREYESDSARHLLKAQLEELCCNQTATVVGAARTTSNRFRPVERPLPLPRIARPPVVARAESVDDLLICPDEDFRQQVNVSRGSIKTIFNAIKLFHPDFQYNDLLMLIWYLSSERSSFEEVAKVFRVPDVDSVLPKLKKICVQLSHLGRNAKMDLPRSEFEEDVIVENFEKMTGIPLVLGGLSVFMLECQDDSWFSVLVVCDHRQYFRHVTISTSLRNVAGVIAESPIYERLSQAHPKNYVFCCPADGYPELPQLVRAVHDDESSYFDEMMDFELSHNKVVNVVRDAIRRAVVRFPKLNSLETAVPEILTGSFLLHNFCIDTRDSSIPVDS